MFFIDIVYYKRLSNEIVVYWMSRNLLMIYGMEILWQRNFF